MKRERCVSYAICEEFNLYLATISNNDLICCNCQNSTESTLTCVNFTRYKPSSVFLGDCMEYIKQHHYKGESHERRKEQSPP